MSPKSATFRLINWADAECTHESRYYRFAHSLCRVIFITLQEFKRNELSLRASALTFTIMLSLVPVLAMSTALVKGLGGGNQLRNFVYGYIENLEKDNAPVQLEENGESLIFRENSQEQKEEGSNSSLTQHLYTAVNQIFDYVDRTNFATLGTIGVAGIFLSVILVLGNIEMAMNAIWHVDSGRSVMRKISDYLALVVLTPISLNIGLAASAVLKSEALLSKFSILLPMVWIQAIILKLIPIFFLALTLYIVYLFFPNTKVKNIPAMAGALFAGYFWFQAQNVYISLQVGVSNYNAIYGSFATLPLFLLWIYFGWIFILLGAQIAYAYQNKDTFRLVAAKAQPSLRLAVAYDLLGYIREGFHAEKKATAPDFLGKYPMHNKTLVDETIENLIEHGMIHHAADNISLMPSIPEEKINHGKVVQAIMGSTFSKTEGGKTSSQVLEAAAFPANTVREKGD